jgi:hypothetical protein
VDGSRSTSGSFGPIWETCLSARPGAELLRWLDGPVTLTPRETKDGMVWTLATALNLAAELPAVKGRKAVTPKASCGGGI